MPLFNLTYEKIEELNSKLKEKEQELYVVKTTPATDVWKKELKELRTEYNKWYKEKHEEFLSNIEDKSKIMVGITDDKMVPIPLKDAIKGGQAIDKDLIRVCDIISI